MGPEERLKDAAAEPRRSFLLSFGLDKLGLVALRAPYVSAVIIAILTALAVLGVMRLKVDDSLSELFRTNTEEFRRYEEIDRRFPSSEYDVLVVVEGKNLLTREGIKAFSDATMELQLVDGVGGLVSMLSARGKPDATGYAPPVVPDELPEGASFAALIAQLKSNDIVKGKFLSDDGELALIVLALDRQVVEEQIGQDRDRRHPGGSRAGTGQGGPFGQADRRAGHAARDPQRGGARPARLQRPRLPRGLRHGLPVLPPPVADADRRRWARPSRSCGRWACSAGSISGSTCSSTSSRR